MHTSNRAALLPVGDEVWFTYRSGKDKAIQLAEQVSKAAGTQVCAA